MDSGRKFTVFQPPLSWRELTVLFGFALATTFSAWLATPYWDDGWFELFRSSGTPFRNGLGDRPIEAMILSWLEQHRVMWPVHYLHHLLGWLAMELAGTLVWSLFFPGLPQLRLLAGCLTIAPVICRCQFCVIFGCPYLTQVAISFLCLWILAPKNADVLFFSWRRILAGILFFLSSLQNEYAVPAGLAVGFLLWFLWRRNKASLHLCLKASWLLPLLSLIGYALFYLTADPKLRSDVRLQSSLFAGQSQLHAFLQALQGLVTDVWQVSLGRALAALGELQPAFTKVGLLIILVGLAAALGLWWASFSRRRSKPVEEAVTSAKWRSVAILLASIVVGLLPVAMMGRSGYRKDVDTRFWLPILPIAACVTVAVLGNLTSRRYRPAMAIVLVFVCGFSLAARAYAEFHDVRITEYWSTVLHRHLSPTGLNVAFFIYEAPKREKCLSIESSYELTARLTREWTVEERNRFWAWTAPLLGYEVPNPPAEIDVTVRGVARKGVVAKFFWISVDESGQMRRLLERPAGSSQWIPAQ